MNVAFGFHRHIKVENVAYVFHINTARGNVCGNQVIKHAVAETIDRPLAQFLRFVAVDGFGFQTKGVDVGLAQAASLSVTGMWNVTTTTVDRIVRLFYDSKARDDVSGVVGSYEATRQSFEFDTVQAVSILALISLSLGIINLFPFLPLDGGHIFWAVAEKVRGRRISLRVMERASIVGFMLVLFLFYVGLSNDIGRLTSGEGFGVR